MRAGAWVARNSRVEGRSTMPESAPRPVATRPEDAAREVGVAAAGGVDQVDVEGGDRGRARGADDQAALRAEGADDGLDAEELTQLRRALARIVGAGHAGDLALVGEEELGLAQRRRQPFAHLVGARTEDVDGDDGVVLAG